MVIPNIPHSVNRDPGGEHSQNGSQQPRYARNSHNCFPIPQLLLILDTRVRISPLEAVRLGVPAPTDIISKYSRPSGEKEHM
jgi:hypothetical protein